MCTRQARQATSLAPSKAAAAPLSRHDVVRSCQLKSDSFKPSQVTKEEYAQHGPVALGNQVVDQLLSQGKRPVLFPAGGSNALGTWGYLDFMRELTEQTANRRFTDIVVVRFAVTLAVSQTKAAPLQIEQGHHIQPEHHQHEQHVMGWCQKDNQVPHTGKIGSIRHSLKGKHVVLTSGKSMKVTDNQSFFLPACRLAAAAAQQQALRWATT